jgi:hypothetical protein
MKQLSEFILDNVEIEQLDEGLLSNTLKTSYVLAQASSSKKNGSLTIKHATDVLRLLSKPIATDHPDSTNLHLDRIEKGLLALANAQIAQRKQIGNGIAIATAGALMSDNVSKQMSKRR